MIGRRDQRERRGQARRQGGRRPVWQRLGVMGGLAVLVLGALAACGEYDDRPYSHITPATEAADDIQGLYKLLFWMALVVFIFVQFLIVYAALRFRRKKSQRERPAQIHGNKTLEIAWTIIPAVVLLIILIPTIQTMYETDAEARDDDGAMVIEVFGKQWWWEVHYPGILNGRDLEGQPIPLMTANEIRIPVGQKVQIKLYSNNVIHSFWVPQLAGKMDVIPGHENYLSFTAREPGTYYGECAEFCGVSHAWMRFIVKAEAPADFDAWVAASGQPPSSAAARFSTDGDVSRTPTEFGLCVTCHNINGTTAQAARWGLATDPTSVNAGPNLTLFACRDTIAAGLLENTPENLAVWLRNPEAVKEGNFMSWAVEEGTLTEEQIAVLVDYLLSLKPEGGCPGQGGAPGSHEPASPAVPAAPAAPAATPVPAGQQPALPPPPRP